VIGHVGGVPVEEVLLPLVNGASAALLLAGAWVVTRIRRPDGVFAPSRRRRNG
jgi:hypothetical protein